MPIYCFQCPRGHKLEKIRDKPYKNVRRFRCEKCGLWLTRDYVAERTKDKEKKHANVLL